MSSIPKACDGCGKTPIEVRKMVGLSTVLICDECVDLAVEIVHDSYAEEVVKIGALELHELRLKAQTADQALIWVDHVKRAVARAERALAGIAARGKQ